MAEPLLAAARLVVKDGMRLGLASDAERHRALSVVWAALSGPGQPLFWNEREISAALKRLLQEPLAFLDTDHAELRRWLVDTGWVLRDGLGREYRRATPGQIPSGQSACAAAFDGIDAVAWAQALRQARQAQRHARHQAWLAEAT